MPPDRPRLVATDLDGTFLRSDGSVSDRSAAVWNALPQHGIETVIVTARPPRWLHALEHLVGPRGVVLCGNGAFVYEVAARRIVESHGFERGSLLGIMDDLRAVVPGIAFAVEAADGPVVGPGWPDGGDIHRVGGADLADGTVGKLLALAPALPTDEFLVTVAQTVGVRGHLAYSGAAGLAEVNPPGVTKAAALAAWCGELGIAAGQVWAFGDMPNDLPMLRWAGHSFAVVNAHPDVLREADVTCASNDDDGVARVLEPLLTGRSHGDRPPRRARTRGDE